MLSTFEHLTGLTVVNFGTFSAEQSVTLCSLELLNKHCLKRWKASEYIFKQLYACHDVGSVASAGCKRGLHFLRRLLPRDFELCRESSCQCRRSFLEGAASCKIWSWAKPFSVYLRTTGTGATYVWIALVGCLRIVPTDNQAKIQLHEKIKGLSLLGIARHLENHWCGESFSDGNGGQY